MAFRHTTRPWVRASLRSVAALCTFALAASTLLAESNWPTWRGPYGNGHSQETNLPQTWGAGSIAWQTPLPGRGHSSPTVWGEQIFLTTAIDDGRERVVLAVNRSDGRVVWSHTAWTGTPEPTHKMNGWASATVATDGERVYAFFGKGGLHCYKVNGEHVWSLDLGTFEGPWGTAACPILWNDLVIQNCDADSNANIAAFNKLTGELVWKTERDNNRGWSSPIFVQTPERLELVDNGDTGPRGYDPATGKDLWRCKSFTGRGTPTVTPAGDLLCVVNGKPGPFYAVRPGGNGDVTGSHMAWHTQRGGGRDLPSPIVIDHYALVINMSGILTCYDARTGKELDKQRVGGNFSSTPIAYGGLAYFVGEDGTTIAVRPGESIEVVSRNELPSPGDALFRASITPSEGQLFIRSDQHLYCIGKRQTPTGK